MNSGASVFLRDLSRSPNEMLLCWVIVSPLAKGGSDVCFPLLRKVAQPPELKKVGLAEICNVLNAIVQTGQKE